MSDKELLELAAKAADEGIVFYGECLRAQTGREWNPLTDDGDALRLAVKLEIAINPFAGKTVVAQNEHGRLGHIKWDCWDDDSCAATRRAIVCLAAEIGKAM